MKKIVTYITFTNVYFYTLIFSMAIAYNTNSQLPILTQVSSTFNDPNGIENAGDNRLFVYESAGIIKIMDLNGTINPFPFLDISSIVKSSNIEQGLLGLAFHPNYNVNGFFYVHYTALDNSSQISRFNVDPFDQNTALPNSEYQLLNVPQPVTNHNGGDLNFGPDGYLYIALGDGGGFNDMFGNGQNTTSLLGSILRINVDIGAPYSIPADNPFSNSPNGPNDNRPEIWAWGLQNPWRFSIDQTNGLVWIGDMEGSGDAEDEINIAQLGDNFGWYNETNGIVEPIFELPDINNPFVVGGIVYHGQELLGYGGSYFYADRANGTVSVLTDTGIWNSTNLTTINGPMGFGEDIFGEIYITSSSGQIYKFEMPNASLEELNYTDKKVVKIIDLVGKETQFKCNVPLLFIYEDGTSKRILSADY